MLNEQLLQHLALQEREDDEGSNVVCDNEVEPSETRVRRDYDKHFQSLLRHTEKLNRIWWSLYSFVISTSKHPLVVELLCMIIGLSAAAAAKTSFFCRTTLETTMDTLPISIGIVAALALRNLFHRSDFSIDKNASKITEQERRDIRVHGLRSRVSNRLGSIGAPPLHLPMETVDMSEWEMYQHESLITSFLESHINLWRCTQDVRRALRLGTAWRLGVVDSRHCESISVERIESTALTRWLRNRQGRVAPSDSLMDQATKRNSFHGVSMPLLRRRVYTVVNQTLVRLHDFAVANSIPFDTFPNVGMSDRVNGESAVVTLAILWSLNVNIGEIVSFILDWLCSRTTAMDDQTRTMLHNCSTEARSSIEYLYSALASSPSTALAMDGNNNENKQLASKLTGLRQQTEMLLAAVMSQQEAVLNTIEEPILPLGKLDDDNQETWDRLQSTFGVLQQMMKELGEQLQSDGSSSLRTAESEQIKPTFDLDLPRLPANQPKDNEMETNSDPSWPQLPESPVEPFVTLIFSGISNSPRQMHRRKRPLARPEGSPMVFPPTSIFDELRERIKQLPPTIERDAVPLDGEIAIDASDCSLLETSKEDDQDVEDTYTGMDPTAKDGNFLGELLVSLSQLTLRSDAGEVTQWGD